MAGSRRSSTKASTSYQEIDSDVDMNQEERVEAKKAKAAKTKARNKAKGKEATNAAHVQEKEESKPALSLDLIMALPLDIQAEICTHLEPKDLLNLCRTCRTCRTFLFSLPARAIWAAARHREKLPLLADYNEIELAVLVFGRTCWECAEKNGDLDCYLRTRLCRTCRKQLVVAKSHAKSRVPTTHARAAECCLTTRFAGEDYVDLLVPPPDWHRAPYCFIPELEAMTVKLLELEEEDEQAEFESMAYGKAKSSRTRTRHLGPEDAHEKDSHVEAFVKEKVIESARLYKESDQLARALKKRQEDISRARDDERKRRELTRAFDKETRKTELRSLGWTERETAFWADRGRFGFWGPKAPSAPPAEDHEAWRQLHAEIVQTLAEEENAQAKEAEERALLTRQGDRQELVRPYYDRLVADLKTEKEKLTFPRFDAFLGLDTIVKLWESDYSFVDEDLWRCKQPIIKEQSEGEIRLDVAWVVCLLGAAQRGHFVKPDVTLGALRDMAFNNLDEFPTDKDIPAFCKRITSHFFFFERWWNGGRHSSDGIDVQPYPKMLAHRDRDQDEDSPVDIVEGSGRSYITVLKAILSAAELDEETATMKQLDERGKTFRWLDYPVFAKERECWEWRQLIREIVNRIKDKPTLPYPTPNIVCDYVKAEDKEMKELEDADAGAESEQSSAED